MPWDLLGDRDRMGVLGYIFGDMMKIILGIYIRTILKIFGDMME
jgi:hypothetical protein